jgi:hypothetical protein
MVARKWVRLAQAVVAELGGASDIRSLSQAPDDVLLRASDRCGLLLAAQFPRVESRLAAIRRRLDEVRDAGSSAGSPGDEGNTPRRALEAIAYRDTEAMGPTELRATVEAARTLVGMDRASQRSRDREKRESQNATRPAEYNIEPTMIPRSIMPRFQSVEIAERAKFAERGRLTQTSEERLRQQAFADQARMQAQYERQAQSALAWGRYCMAALHPPEDTPRRIGMPGLGGM